VTEDCNFSFEENEFLARVATSGLFNKRMEKPDKLKLLQAGLALKKS
jgi:hypothetical protein